MSVHIQTLGEISSRARNALVKELGVVDTLRFLSQLRAGSGDYAKEREQLFKGESVESLLVTIKAKRNAPAQHGTPEDRS